MAVQRLAALGRYGSRPPSAVGRGRNHASMAALKSSQRLDYANLSEVLGQRGLVQPQRLSLALQTSGQAQVPFPEMLVTDNLIGDWELSRVVCDLYSLAFLPVDIYRPDPEAMKGLDPTFLLHHRLVPLARHGQLLTVAMPGLVQAEVLAALSVASDLQIVPVVGTVVTNNAWLQEHLSSAVEPALPGEVESQWSNIFDEGDAAVLFDLQAEPIGEGGDGDVDPAVEG